MAFTTGPTVFLPSLYQGTVLRPKEPRIANLDAPPHLRGAIQRRNLNFLRELNERHARAFPAEADLEARIASYELAAAMQTSAREALDISSESDATKKLYGIDRPVTRDYGTRCLIARRLVERGVRFVQLFHQGQPWDNHSSIQSALPAICAKTDQPSAALVTDLEQRGLLDSTIVHWGGEIGRLPVTENHGGDAKKNGRDHNGQGFTIWLAGGGIRGGITYGETDDVGHRAVIDRVDAERLPGHLAPPLRARPSRARLRARRAKARNHGGSRVPRRARHSGLTASTSSADVHRWW